MKQKTKDHTYIVNHKTVSKHVEERLKNILQIMKSHCRSDLGLLVNSSLKKFVVGERSKTATLIAQTIGESFIEKYP